VDRIKNYYDRAAKLAQVVGREEKTG
jgi:hypothetical protein